MNQTNRTNFTNISFTVQDDLISLTSANTYNQLDQTRRVFQPNPFTRDYGIKGAEGLNNFNKNLQQKKQNKVKERAQMDAYRQLNNELFNPFQHKLQKGFIPKESDLYQQQKQTKIMTLKQQQQKQMNQNTNYVIVFKNQKQSNSIKLTANNILNNEGDYSISDYYKKNIQTKKKESMKDIKQQAQDDDNPPLQDDSLNNDENKAHNKLFAKSGSQKIQRKDQNHNINKNGQTLKRNSKKQIEVEQPKSENIIERMKQQHNKQRPQVRISLEKPKSRQVKKAVNNFVAKKEQPPQIKNIPKVLRQIPKSKPVQKNIKGNAKLIGNKNNNNSKFTKEKRYSQIYEGPDRNLVQQIQNEITQRSQVSFDDIAQLENAKNLLQQAVLLPRMMPEFFKGIRKAMKGILLFGPPGTGKTLLAKAVAKDNMFFNVSASSLASKWKGQSQKMVRILFQIARYYSPSVIFFDEIDSIASKRTQNQHQSSRKVKTELLVQMDGVQSTQSQVFVLAATNRPWDLDQALRRRLQKRIYIPLPQKTGRKKMFQINLKEIKISKSANWDKILKQTKGYSGADIANVCRDAAYMPMRRILLKIGGIQKISLVDQQQLLNEQLSEQDLLQAIKNSKPSVNLDDLKKYQKWVQQFGSQ